MSADPTADVTTHGPMTGPLPPGGSVPPGGRRVGVTREPQRLFAAAVGVIGAAVATAGTFVDWFTIEVAGVTAPGGTATGWEGRDGRTVLAGAVVSAVAAAAVAMGSRLLAPKIALVVAGGVTGVIGVAGILDTSTKAENVQDEFAIPADQVDSTVGAGLWLVAAAGGIELLAGLATRTPTPDG